MKTKRILRALLLASGIFLWTVLPVQAYQLDFEYQGVDYGTMDISVNAGGDLLVSFALNTGLPGTAKVAGFGFSLDELPTVVTNPANGLNNVNWYPLTNLNALPQPTNDSTVRKDDFTYGVTTARSTKNINQSSGAIGEGQLDYFLLAFEPDITLGDYGTGFVNFAGVRLQGLSNDVNGGSLFLVPSVVPNAPVPEPATMLLLGSGLVGLATIGRKRLFRKI